MNAQIQMSDSNNSVAWKPDVAKIVADLAPVLNQLEQQRLTALGKRKTGGLVAAVIAGAGLLIGLLVSQAEPGAGLFTIFGAIVIALIAYMAIQGSATKEYLRQFKHQAFKEAARLVAPGIHYLPDSMVGMNQFKRSHLFNSRIDRYHGEDCFHGKVGETEILLSELHVERKETTTDSKGRSQTRWVTVFQGIYLIADFNKAFHSWVLVEPDVAEANFGWLGRKLQGLSGDLVRLENPEFERAFKIRAGDQVEARYLLTPDFQERLLRLRNTWPKGLSAAFIDSQMHLAIPKRENWFEPNLHQPANQTHQLKMFLEQLVILLYIPEVLDLNTRIWTK
ncbi:DUF3137 domain-containing protein [Luteolibacter pohnpeiensis]|uniref:DUF3137 domain-containing protein n=1 Tax=Luteolibacter pohnpeiensis TaxID=454153 RepID=A0A934S9S5_9BACT|nr:DUF3137 domain-containing protein [Luteolibacter pohnpeiensis]MBK1881418.1 DUF3137 domain-containing protein [Luteolibacter pohnpeiensis]